MRFIADLHIHSRYSRATSRDMSPETLWRWAQLKGIGVIASGDFTHPLWLQELKEKLSPEGNGLFSLTKSFQTSGVPETCRAGVSFLLSSEISCIYRKGDRVRKVHAIIFAPGFGDAEKINAALSKVGNLKSDGRPILGIDAKELLRIVLDASDAAMLVPAHAWTPHFSVFGAASGFDSLEECFGELTPHIRAIETGLSSDPPMNWRLSSLDGITLISNSDAHSPSKIGREANILDTGMSYPDIMRALTTREGFLGTIEFFPEEGKYHHDGHRACRVNLSPEETLHNKSLCPVCGKKVTVGVKHRVERLADREEGFRPEGAPDFHRMIPLQELIAETIGVGEKSKAVEREYSEMTGRLGNEFRILLELPAEEIAAAGYRRAAEAIARMRAGDVDVTPGFDGEYGTISIFEHPQKRKKRGTAGFSHKTG